MWTSESISHPDIRPHNRSNSDSSKASKTSEPDRSNPASETSNVTTPTPSPETSTLDDVFGEVTVDSHSDTAFPSQISQTSQSTQTMQVFQQHPSDTARLRGIHVTAGYREGIAQARSAAVQGGFDEGWMLGAAVGLRVGVLLGVIEGVVAAFQHAGLATLDKGVGEGTEAGDSETPSRTFTPDRMASVRRRAQALLVCMRRDLKAESVFGEEFVSLDGTWNWHVEAEEVERHGMDCVAEAHPLVRKYAAVVARWVRALDLQREGDGSDDKGQNG